MKSKKKITEDKVQEKSFKALGKNLIIKMIIPDNSATTKSGIILMNRLNANLCNFGIGKILNISPECKQLKGEVEEGDYILYEIGAERVYQALDSDNHIYILREIDVYCLMETKDEKELQDILAHNVKSVSGKRATM